MDQALHKVTKEEITVLRQWLEKHLPHSFKIYGTAYLEETGKWSGTTFYTLGWPEILAVGEGPADPVQSLCADFYNNTRHLSCFSPNIHHLEALLNRPDFLDWTKPIMFQGLSRENADFVQRISESKGAKYNKRLDVHLLGADPCDIKPIPIPEVLEMRQLDSNTHSDYIASTWALRRKYSESYVRALIECLPSVALYDRNGEVVALEMSSEYRSTVFLYVKEEARKRGLGQCVASHLAQSHFENFGSVLTTVVCGNKPSLDLHLKLGYKILCPVVWFLHSVTDEKILEAL